MQVQLEMQLETYSQVSPVIPDGHSRRVLSSSPLILITVQAHRCQEGLGNTVLQVQSYGHVRPLGKREMQSRSMVSQGPRKIMRIGWFHRRLISQHLTIRCCALPPEQDLPGLH